MNIQIRHASRTAFGVLASLAATTALCQTTIPGDVVVPAGTTLEIGSDTTFTGSLTIEPGAMVSVDPGFWITIDGAATLDVAGTEAEPVLFSASAGVWNGIILAEGSAATVDHALLTDLDFAAFEVDAASLTLTNSEIFDTPGAAITHSSTRFAVFAHNGAELSVDACVIGPIGARDGASGTGGGTNSNGQNAANGRSVIAIDAAGIASLSVTNTRFVGIRGGTGGRGGNGGNGSTGGTGSNAGVGGTPGTGGTGQDGGDGGDGGSGGIAIIINANAVGQTTIAQNIVEYLAGGTGGPGGHGGTGGRGGKGGTGATGVVGNGGTGGRGGRGGRGGNAGDGGDAGDAIAFNIINPVTAPVIASNTVYRTVALQGAPAGIRGSGGAGGPGGNGGSAGIGGSTGSTGPSGSGGSPGSTAPPGMHAQADGVSTAGADSNGFAALANNNIFTFTDIGPKTGFASSDSGVIDIASNIVGGASFVSTGPTTGSAIAASPLFVNAGAGDFTPAPGSPAIDSGDNSLSLPGITLDFVGNPRFADDTVTPNTGVGGTYIIDMGAIELPGETPSGCPADANGDGVLTPSDFSAWIIAYNTQSAPCDQNGDGVCTPSDFTSWIFNYNAGCS